MTNKREIVNNFLAQTMGIQYEIQFSNNWKFSSTEGNPETEQLCGQLGESFVVV